MEGARGCGGDCGNVGWGQKHEDLLKRMEVSVKEFPRDGKARDKICKGTEVEGKDLFGKISVNKQVMLFQSPDLRYMGWKKKKMCTLLSQKKMDSVRAWNAGTAGKLTVKENKRGNGDREYSLRFVHGPVERTEEGGCLLSLD